MWVKCVTDLISVGKPLHTSYIFQRICKLQLRNCSRCISGIWGEIFLAMHFFFHVFRVYSQKKKKQISANAWHCDALCQQSAWKTRRGHGTKSSVSSTTKFCSIIFRRKNWIVLAYIVNSLLGGHAWPSLLQSAWGKLLACQMWVNLMQQTWNCFFFFLL